MNDSTLHTLPEPEVLPLIERGYTLRRKFVIGIWSMLFLLSLTITYFLFALVAEGIDFFVHVHTQLQLMSNIALGHRDLESKFDIPLVGPLRAIFFALSTCCGGMTILKLFIPPPVRTHNVVIHHFAHPKQK